MELVKWEYRQENLTKNGYDRIKLLNELGRDGWELVQIENFYEPFAVAIFKRACGLVDQ